MKWIYNDGGRALAGFRGTCGDCVTRALAIAMERPYGELYAILADGQGSQRKGKGRATGRTARSGINTKRKWFKDFMIAQGWAWIPCMGIGTGCKVHLRENELPPGRLIAVVSRHYCAVIDGVINDIHDPGREGSRCVYGYWIKR